MLDGFKKFILKGNVVDLAVGVVIGASFGKVVTALVEDFITPLIGAIGGTPNFSSIHFAVRGSKFLVGDLMNAVLAFVINAAVIYFFVVIPMNHLLAKMMQEKPKDPSEKQCPECLSTIPHKASRCMYCTASQTKSK